MPGLYNPFWVQYKPFPRCHYLMEVNGQDAHRGTRSLPVSLWHIPELGRLLDNTHTLRGRRNGHGKAKIYSRP